MGMPSNESEAEKAKGARRARPTRHERWAATLACGVIAAAIGLLCLVSAGCRTSDTLVEVVYTQEAPTVDPDAPQKNYVLSAEADQSMPLDEANSDLNDIARQKVTETLPIFGTPATTSQTIDQVLYDQNSGVSRTAPIFPNDPQDLSSEQDNQQDISGGGSEVDSQDEGNADDDDGPEENDEATRGVSMHDDSPKVYNASGGLLAPLENVRTIATVGEYADMVLALGGPGTLVAGDSAFLGSEAVGRIFSDEDWQLGDVPAVWTYDEASNTYELDFDALLAADPDMVWVPDGVDLLTEDQRDQLLDRGISVEPAPLMDSARSLSEMARWLGDTLADHTVSGCDASAAADSYIDTYLGSDIDALIDENGGLTSYNGIDYSGGSHTIASVSNWTLLVTDWDDTATYSAGLWSAQGVAIAKAGYGWSPVDYYLSVGGVNNNAAQFPVPATSGKKSGEYYVWQFNMSMLDPADVVGNKAVEDFGTTSYGWTQCLVGAPASVNREAVFETTLGADDFRYLLCANQDIASKLAQARDEDTASQTGLYAAYDYSVGQALQESGVGPRTADGVLIRAIIGATGTGTTSIGQERTAAGQNPYEVVTAGNGLYCDWLEGSMESFLLAFWTDDFYDAAKAAAAGEDDGAVTVDDVDFSGLDQEATRFYLEFYGYELTDEDLTALHEGRVG